MLILISYLLSSTKWKEKYNGVENVKEKKEKD